MADLGRLGGLAEPGELGEMGNLGGKGANLVRLRDAGFPDAAHRQLSGGLTQLMVGTRHR